MDTTRIFLFERRREKGFALGELARAVGIGTVELSRIERGKIRPSEDIARAIGENLDWTLEQVQAGLPTDEETEANAGRDSDALIALSAVAQDAKERGLKKGNGGRARIACPICKRGQLSYSVAGYNGHIWGTCTTEGCVRWMQ